jgi:DNA-binding Xre family transcriptional regulator
MSKKKHPNVGSSLEDFLHEEGIADAATAIAVKRVIAWQLKQAMSERRLSKTAMAARMETTRAQLDRLLNPLDGNVTIETLQRAATAVGKKLKFELA